MILGFFFFFERALPELECDYTDSEVEMFSYRQKEIEIDTGRIRER